MHLAAVEMGPKDRGERQLMRQRGAGTRQVKNIGFDLVLPGQENATTEPLQPIKSGRSRKTPQPELPPQRSSRRTPKPETTQLQQSSRKTPATGFTKKRGRPAKRAVSDIIEDSSTSRVTQADKEGVTTKKRKTSKAQKEQGDAVLSNAPEVQGDGLGTRDADPSAAPSTGVKKRKKRKSIGQQATSRAKAAKARSPLKPARQSRKKTPKPDLAEVTDLDGSLAKEARRGLATDAVSLDGGEPAHLPEVTGALDSGIDNLTPSAEKPQQEIAQKPKKRKRFPVEELPNKRVKASSTQSKRAPKAPKPQEEIISAEDALNAVQIMETPAEAQASLLENVNEEQDDGSEVAELRKEKPKKRKRVTVGQQPKKRAKVGTTKPNRKLKAREETSTAEGAPEASQRMGESAEVEADTVGHVAEEPEATAEEAEPQTQKPKRKKRKSIGQQKPKKKPMDLATPDRTASKAAARGQLATRNELNSKPTARRGRPRAKERPEEVIEKPLAGNLGHVPEEEAEIQFSEPALKDKHKARRGRPKAKPISEHAIDEPDEEARRDTPEEEEEVPAPIMPEKKRRGRPRKADAAQSPSLNTRTTKVPASRKPKAKAASATAPKARAPPKDSIPITIYAPPSPTSDAEDDPLSTSQPHTTVNTINAVDVLSQLCSELLSKSSSALAEQAHSDDPSTNQSELKRTKQTTDLYAKELASRLLQLTTTLNTNTSLQSRVRAAAKEDRRLKKELKRLEKEREDLGSRKEEVMKERKKKELEELLTGIAGAVKRGWDMQEEGEEGEGDAVAGMVEEVDLEV
ncbi:hypothetical protein HO133_008405 [Letharia lupina]|uniref:Inner kinetochore subunit AME1 domain-containing protein n=1 Tax=Letharia lupina TaxID=560253 RepID=A0A8H6CNU6_9LECA|nr:uncharacterized protein HO133_008405 [Letharia lupina]KAF6226964.1 hypothetical protein HO133_008405 [Letharia lupina]